MKKYIFSLLAPLAVFALAVGFGGAANVASAQTPTPSPTRHPDVTIISPNGGETFAQGESLNVIWTSDLPSQPVDVKILNSAGEILTNLVQNNIRPANSSSQSIGFPSRIPLGQYKARVCASATTICDDGNGYFTIIAPVTNINPVISYTTPPWVSVGSQLTVYLANAGRSGNIILTNFDGSKSWSTGYSHDVRTLNGFSQYDGSKLTITIPSTIGRGVNPGMWNEPTVSLTPGTYKLYVSTLDANNNFVKSNVVNVEVGGNSITPPTNSTDNCGAYYYYNNLTVGSTGADVVALQTRLIASGYDIYLISSGRTAKGYFGPATSATLGQYQRAVGLAATGELDAQTRSYLNNHCLGTTPPTVPSIPSQPAFVCPPNWRCIPIVTDTKPVTNTTNNQTRVNNFNGKVSASVISNSTEDRAGIWGVFTAGPAHFGSDSSDMAWNVSITGTNVSSNISSMTILSNYSGEGWSTSRDGGDLAKQLYPLVVLDSTGSQLNTAYDQQISRANSSSGVYEVNTYKVYGQKTSSTWPGGTLIVKFTDGTQGVANIPEAPVTNNQATASLADEPVVIYPNGGENITIPPGTINIMFKSVSGKSYGFDLKDMSRVNPTVYMLGNAVGTGGTQKVVFQIPTYLTSGKMFKVTVYCKNDSCDPTSDSSDSYFTISAVSTLNPSPTPGFTDPYISSVSSPANPASTFYPGDWVTLTGYAFPQDPSVYIGSSAVAGHTNSTGTTVGFSAPSSLSPGNTTVSVVGKAMISNKVNVTVLRAGTYTAPASVYSTPSPTPSPTPIPSPILQPTIPAINASARVTSTATNNAGTWGVFGPGSYGSNTNDWGWTLNMSMDKARTIKSIDLSAATGDAWSTSDSANYPLVVFKSGVQQNTSYGQTIEVNPNSQLLLYGQQVAQSWNGGTVKIYFTDGSTATASIPAYSGTAFNVTDQNSQNAAVRDAVIQYWDSLR